VRSLDQGRAGFLQVVAKCIVPEIGGLDAEGSRRFAEIVDGALQDREPGMRRQFAIFLTVLRWAPVLRFARPFHRLGPARQERFLRWLQDCPVGLLRSGFWGLKAIVFMGYYGQPKVGRAIGYMPELDGNAELHARRRV
jgi:hypothetical protein